MYYIISLYYKYGESSIDTVDDDNELTSYLLNFISNLGKYYFKSDDKSPHIFKSKDILREYKDVYKCSKKNKNPYTLKELINITLKISDILLENQEDWGIKYIIKGSKLYDIEN